MIHFIGTGFVIRKNRRFIEILNLTLFFLFLLPTKLGEELGTKYAQILYNCKKTYKLLQVLGQCL